MWRAPCDIELSLPIVDHHHGHDITSTTNDSSNNGGGSSGVDYATVTFRFGRGDLVERLLQRFGEYEAIPRAIQGSLAYHIHTAMSARCHSNGDIITGAANQIEDHIIHTTAASTSTGTTMSSTSTNQQLPSTNKDPSKLSSLWSQWYTNTTSLLSSGSDNDGNGNGNDDTSDIKRITSTSSSSLPSVSSGRSEEATPPPSRTTSSPSSIASPTTTTATTSTGRRRVMPVTLPSLRSVYQTRNGWRQWSRAYHHVTNTRYEYRVTLWHLERTFATDVLTSLTLREREFDALQMKQGLEMQTALESPPVISSITNNNNNGGNGSNGNMNGGEEDDIQQRASTLVHAHMAARRALEIQWNDTLYNQRMRQITDYRRHVMTLYEHDHDNSTSNTTVAATLYEAPSLARSGSSSSLNNIIAGMPSTSVVSAGGSSSVICTTTLPSCITWRPAVSSSAPLLPSNAVDIVSRVVWLGTGVHRSCYNVRLILGDVIDVCAARHYNDIEMDICQRRSQTLYSNDSLSAFILPCDIDSLTDMGLDIDIATASVAASNAKHAASTTHSTTATSTGIGAANKASTYTNPDLDNDDTSDDDDHSSSRSVSSTLDDNINNMMGDGHTLSQSWPRCRELARACRSTELHFPTYRQQLASCARRIVRLAAVRNYSSPLASKAVSSNDGGEVSARIQSSELSLDDIDDHNEHDDDINDPNGPIGIDDTSLHSGDIVMTRHSNLLSAHIVIYLICDTTIPSDLNSVLYSLSLHISHDR
jgi:hypothetical protein